MTIATLDDLSRQLKQDEQALRQLSEKMLIATAAKFGKDSREYGQAGGTPRSERRRPTRQTQEPIAKNPTESYAALEWTEGERSASSLSVNTEMPLTTNGNGKAVATNGKI